MIASPVIRELGPGDWEMYRELRLRALADSPNAFGATLAASRSRPMPSWRERLAAAARGDDDRPLVASVNGQHVGLAWGKIFSHEPSVAHVFQMWVAPRTRRSGAGRLLLAEIVGWARTRRVRRVTLGVSCENEAAIRLYERTGFIAAGEPEPLRPGSPVLAQEMRLELGMAPEQA